MESKTIPIESAHIFLMLASPSSNSSTSFSRILREKLSGTSELKDSKIFVMRMMEFSRDFFFPLTVNSMACSRTPW